MFQALRSALLFSALVFPLTAQTTYVSPPHAVNLEGNSSSGVVLFRNTAGLTRYQHVDQNLIGSKFVLLQRLAFRRSNSHSQTGATARKADVRVDLGHGVTAPTPTFDSNYKKNARTTVFKNKTVAFPDWTRPISTPSPFNVEFRFDTPFIYNLSDPIVWDLLVSKIPSAGPYYMDWFSSVPPTTRGSKPGTLGSGCTTRNGRFAYSMSFTASSNQIFAAVSASGAPANTGVIPALGLRDPDAKLGYCTNLRTDALFLLPAVTANAAGNATASFTFPWVSSAAGVMLFTQAGAADSSKPGQLALSNGIACTTPFVNGGGTGSAFKIYNLYSIGNHGPTGIGTLTALVARFGM